MPLQKRPDQLPRTIEELLAEGEKYVTWAMNNYGMRNGGNENAGAASSIATALGILAIARILNEQYGGSQQVDTPTQMLNVDSRPELKGE